MKVVIAALLTLLIVGCSGQPVQTHYYLLRSEDPISSRQLNPSERFAMGSVNIAPYIDQPGVVLQLGGGEIRPAMHHQWAEPMRDSVRNFLLVAVSQELGEDVFPSEISNADTVLDIRINQLHGTQDGEVVLSAVWMLRKGNDLVASYNFLERSPLSNDGYPALVEAQEALLQELASTIANSMQDSPAG